MSPTIYIARHGESVANVERRYPTPDVPLSENGIKQARTLAEFLVGKDIKAIYTSPAVRALETARICGERLGLDVITVDAFSDFSFGIFNGRKFDGSDEEIAFHISQRRKSPLDYRFPEGENFYDLHKRVIPAFEKILIKHPEESFLIVNHLYGNRLIIRSLIGISMGGMLNIHQPNDCLYLFDSNRLRYLFSGKIASGYLKKEDTKGTSYRVSL